MHDTYPRIGHEQRAAMDRKPPLGHTDADLHMAMGRGHADGDLDMAMSKEPLSRHADDNLDIAMSRKPPLRTQTMIWISPWAKSYL